MLAGWHWQVVYRCPGLGGPIGSIPGRSRAGGANGYVNATLAQGCRQTAARRATGELKQQVTQRLKALATPQRPDESIPQAACGLAAVS
jgi:hypothetical protein